MGSLFDSGTKQVQQQAVQTALPPSEVNRLASITGQQQSSLLKKRQQPARTVLGTPVQQVGNTSSMPFGVSPNPVGVTRG
jgi:hypothetical protein